MGKKRKKNLNKSILILLFILVAIILNLLFSFFKLSPSYSPTDPTDYVCEGDPGYPQAELGKSTIELCLDEGFTNQYKDTDGGIKWQTQYADGWHSKGKTIVRGICGSNNGYFYIDSDPGQAGHDGPLDIKVPSDLPSGVYKINLWYSIQEYQKKEDFKILCKLENTAKEYFFYDKDLKNNCPSYTSSTIDNCPKQNDYFSLKEKPGSSSYTALCTLDSSNPTLKIFQIDSIAKDQGSVHIEKFQLHHCVLKKSPPPPLQCPNECSPAGKKCDPTNKKVIECKDFNGDLCREEESKDCLLTEICQNGECQPRSPQACNDECSKNKRECLSDKTYKHCDRNYDGDTCLEWGPSQNCPQDYTCDLKTGNCILSPGIPPVIGEAKFAQLPFFNLFNFITTIIAVTLIYTLINISKSSKKYR